MSPVSRGRILLYTLLTIVCAAVDLVSKSVVFDRLGLHRGTDWLVDGWLKLRLFTNLNHGALWGVGQGFSLGFAGISLLALAGINYWLFWRGAAASRWLTVALGLVSGGTIGNLYDRLGLHGLTDPQNGQAVYAVRDFLDARLGSFDWAVFNIADVCLVCGAMMLVIQSFQTPPRTDDNEAGV